MEVNCPLRGSDPKRCCWRSSPAEGSGWGREGVSGGGTPSPHAGLLGTTSPSEGLALCERSGQDLAQGPFCPLTWHRTWWRCCVVPTRAYSSSRKGQLCYRGQLGTPQEHFPAESWQHISVWWRMLSSCSPSFARRCRGQQGWYWGSISSPSQPGQAWGSSMG